jgi:hypothetical protein
MLLNSPHQQRYWKEDAMSTRRNLALAFAVLALTAAGAGGAQAAPVGHHNIPGAMAKGFTGTSSSPSSKDSGNAIKPNDGVEVGCSYNSGAPNFLVKGQSTIYADANITACTTSPAPLECHLTSTIERYQSNGVADVWATVSATKDSGWGACSKKVYTPSYKCVGLVEKKDYRTETTLAITYDDDGTIGSTSTYQYSGTSVLYCD